MPYERGGKHGKSGTGTRAPIFPIFQFSLSQFWGALHMVRAAAPGFQSWRARFGKLRRACARPPRRIRNAGGFHSPKPASIARHHFDQPCRADGVGGFVPSSPVGIALPSKPHANRPPASFARRRPSSNGPGPKYRPPPQRRRRPSTAPAPDAVSRQCRW